MQQGQPQSECRNSDSRLHRLWNAFIEGFRGQTSISPKTLRVSQPLSLAKPKPSLCYAAAGNLPSKGLKARRLSMTPMRFDSSDSTIIGSLVREAPKPEAFAKVVVE